METPVEFVFEEWTSYKIPTPADKSIFDKSLRGYVGVDFLPTSVSIKNEEEGNYRFKCKASMPLSNEVWEAVIEIVNPIGGEPFVSNAVRV